jgi:hypothetical protein
LREIESPGVYNLQNDGIHFEVTANFF